MSALYAESLRIFVYPTVTYVDQSPQTGVKLWSGRCSSLLGVQGQQDDQSALLASDGEGGLSLCLEVHLDEQELTWVMDQWTMCAPDR